MVRARRGAAHPHLRRPGGREVVDRDGVDGAQAGGDGLDRLRPASSPRVADRGLAGDRGGEQPLRLGVRAGGEDAWCRMAMRDPLEPDPLAVEVDARASRVPLQVLIADAERQPAELVAPDEVGGAAPGQLRDDPRNRIVAKGVEGGEVSEVRIRHLERGRYAASYEGGSSVSTGRRRLCHRLVRRPAAMARPRRRWTSVRCACTVAGGGCAVNARRATETSPVPAPRQAAPA